MKIYYYDFKSYLRKRFHSGIISSDLLNAFYNYGCYISGGSLYNYIHNYEGDLDIFCTNKSYGKHIYNMVEKYCGKDYLIKGSNLHSVKFNNIDLIYGQWFINEPKDVIDIFDFKHTMWCYEIKENKLYIPPSVLECNIEKKLILVKPENFTNRQKKVEKG